MKSRVVTFLTKWTSFDPFYALFFIAIEVKVLGRNVFVYGVTVEEQSRMLLIFEVSLEAWFWILYSIGFYQKVQPKDPRVLYHRVRVSVSICLVQWFDKVETVSVSAFRFCCFLKKHKPDFWRISLRDPCGYGQTRILNSCWKVWSVIFLFLIERKGFITFCWFKVRWDFKIPVMILFFFFFLIFILSICEFTYDNNMLEQAFYLLCW